MKVIACCLALLLLSIPAAAEFSVMEKDEIQKLVLARISHAKAVKRIGEALEEGSTEANRAGYFEALNSWVGGYFTCGFAFGSFINSPVDGKTQLDRPARVTKAFSQLENCQAAIADTQEAIDAILDSAPGKLGSAKNLLASASANLASIDTSLSYLDWEPESFPRIIGPHGEYLYGQQLLMRTHEYFSQTTRDAIVWYAGVELFPTSAKGAFGNMLTQVFNASEAHTRGWALASQIILPDDFADILADEEAGSGLRPFSFFIEPLAIEYLYNKDETKVNFAGRRLKKGASTRFFAMGAAFSAAVSHAAVANSGDEVKQWLLPGGGKTFNNFSELGRVAEFQADFGDFWKDHDNYAPALQVFFFEIPAPPGGGPPPPSPTCPEFVAKLVLLDGVTGEARCVLQP